MVLKWTNSSSQNQGCTCGKGLQQQEADLCERGRTSRGRFWHGLPGALLCCQVDPVWAPSSLPQVLSAHKYIQDTGCIHHKGEPG